MNNFCFTNNLLMGKLVFWFVLSHLVIGGLVLIGWIDYSFWVAVGTWIGSLVLGEVVERVVGWMKRWVSALYEVLK